MVGLIVYIEQAFRNHKYRWKGRCFKFYLFLHGCKVGKGLKCMEFPKLRAVPKQNITIGNDVTIGRSVTFEIGHEGKLVIGNNVLLADSVLLSTISEIRIGNWAAIAENSSIRGSFHKMKKNQPYRLQGNVSEPIIIEEDTGIAAGCVVLMGVTIPKGAFIGSNSTVIKNIELVPYGIYGGTPLKLLKLRE
tara:strand:- start:12795 stop:13367 length:573 start_codon:yes stop_codon:yes gene_type:complete